MVYQFVGSRSVRDWCGADVLGAWTASNCTARSLLALVLAGDVLAPILTRSASGFKGR